MSDELVKGLKEAKEAAEKKKNLPEEEPEIRQEEEKPSEPMILCKLEASIDENGKLNTKMGGEFQNIALARGLIALLDHEFSNLQSLQPGAQRSPEILLMKHIKDTMANISNVLVNMNGVLISMQQQINHLPSAILSGTDLTEEDLKG